LHDESQALGERGDVLRVRGRIGPLERASDLLTLTLHFFSQLDGHSFKLFRLLRAETLDSFGMSNKTLGDGGLQRRLLHLDQRSLDADRAHTL
jgi:hypothetical protein